MGKLKDYIAYARTRCQPEISDAAAEDLVAGYLQMRRNGVSRKTITATPRQLESLVRLSEALARMRLSPSVDRSDVAEALRLMKVGPGMTWNDMEGKAWVQQACKVCAAHLGW